MCDGRNLSLAIFFAWVAFLLSALIIRSLMVKRIEFRFRPSIELAAHRSLYRRCIVMAVILDVVAVAISLTSYLC